MRLRHVKNASIIIEENRNLVIEDPTQYKGKWRELLGITNGTLSLEIGCGKGQFLTANAKEYPNNGYIGLEMMSSVICRAVQKVNEAEVKNVLLINKDGANILDYFEVGEIDMLYINFPDPWPKARHEKRRLTSPLFLDKYKVILAKDGIFRFKTDNLDLYNYSLETIPSRLNDGYESGEVDYSTPQIQTEFETKFKNAGNPIYYIRGSFKD